MLQLLSKSIHRNYGTHGVQLANSRISHKKFLKGLKVYKELLGDVKIPMDFIVPVGDARWPAELQGKNLGKKIKEIRSMFHRNVLTDSYIQELEKLNFSWDANTKQYRWNELVLPTLKTYKEIYGDLLIPFDFTVPCEPPWVVQAWGWNFGSTVSDIRSRKDFVRHDPERVKLLNNLGFVWNFLETRYDQIIFPCIEIYKKIHNHLEIPKSFVVPNSKEWPEKYYNFRLGDAVNKIRMGTYMKKYPERQKQLNEIGFDWGCSTFRFETVILPALRQYFKLYKNWNIPKDFVIPSTHPWKKEAHCLRLGDIVHEFNALDSYVIQDSQKKKQLEELGYM